MKKKLSIVLLLYSIYLVIIIFFTKRGPLLPWVNLYQDIYLAPSGSQYPFFGTCKDYCSGNEVTIFEKSYDSYGVFHRTKTNMCFGSVESGC